MKKLIFLGILIFLMVSNTKAQFFVGIDLISATSPVWVCQSSSWTGNDSPPYKFTYRNNNCGGIYSFEKLVKDAYWFDCDANGPDSHYWFLFWYNEVGPICYDDSSNPFATNCEGTVLGLDLEENQGYYIQFDLFSQCTGCSSPVPAPGTWDNTEGSWWSTKGAKANPTNSELAWLIYDANEVSMSLENGEVNLYDLFFVGSPPCDCGNNIPTYGCADDETTG